MKTIKESMGLVMAAALIVAFVGVAGWSVYGGFKEQQFEPAPASADDRPKAEPAKPQENPQLNLEQRVQRLERELKMTETAAREASSSVALIVGEYIWTDATGRRPLRSQGVDEKGQEIVAFDGDGPVVVRDFTGTGFVLSSGEVLTSGFVLNPWYTDPLLDESEPPQRVPTIRMLHAYLPGHSLPIDLKIERAAENAETVLCAVERGSIGARGLQLSKSKVQTGEALVSIGYPGGVPLLASRLSDDQKRELFKFGASNTDALATWLAARNLIQPVVMQARVNVQTDDRIFYDMVNTLGSTGAPLIDVEGRVKGMSEAVSTDYPSVNLAIAVSSFKPWLEQATRASR